MLSRQGNSVFGSNPKDDIMLYAMDCAVPGFGGGPDTIPPPPPPPVVAVPPPLVDPAVALARDANLGAPTTCIVWVAVARTIICWRCCSSTAMARVPGS